MIRHEDKKNLPVLNRKSNTSYFNRILDLEKQSMN